MLSDLFDHLPYILYIYLQSTGDIERVKEMYEKLLASFEEDPTLVSVHMDGASCQLFDIILHLLSAL